MPPRTGGVDSTRRGKAPPLAVFGDFLAAESHPWRGASPRLANLHLAPLHKGNSKHKAMRKNFHIALKTC